MIKEIELYQGKKILVDFDKIKKIICTCFAIFLFIIYILLRDYKDGLGAVSLKNIIFMVVTSVTMIVLIATRVLEKNFKITKYDILLGIYFVIICLAALYSEYRTGTIFGSNGRGEGVIALLCYIFCFYIFYNGFSFNSKVFDYITIAVLIVSCYGIVQSLISDRYNFLGGYENMGYSNFGNPNMFSSFLSLFLPIYLVKYFSDDSENDINIYHACIIFAAVICSKTFGGYITFAIYFTVICIYFLIVYKEKKEILIRIGKVALAFLVILLVLNGSNDNAYLQEINVNKLQIQEAVNNKETEKVGNYRGFIWEMCLEIVEKHPIFGIGPDSLGKEVRQNYMDKDNYILEDTLVDKAHNEYLHIAVTTGIPSLIIYIIFIMVVLISLLIKYIKYVKTGEVLNKNTMMLVAVTASISAYLVQAFGNISIVAVAPLFWAMLGIGARISCDKE